MIILNRCSRFFKHGFGGSALMLVSVLPVLSTAHAATAAVRPKQVVLLLHGLNSNLKTWNKLVSNNAGFDGQCGNPRDADFASVKLTPNSEGVYCMRVNFGMLDRNISAPKGLDKKICAESGGCQGDYSTFDSLGKEIAWSVNRIKSRFGSTVQIVLLGHSRGGLAARAFLQSPSPFKQHVVGLITTGTPHAGTPLGRYHNYLEKTCLPESKYDGFFDTGDCADDWRFVNSSPIKAAAGLDLKAPTIGFLSEISPEISVLNKKISALPSIKMTQLSYGNIKFGCLGGDVIDSQKNCGYDIFGNIWQFKPSRASLNNVLNGRVRDALRGDGIVPVNSQKMNKLYGWKLPVKAYAKLERVHIVETQQVLDLTTALTNMYQQVGWVL